MWAKKLGIISLALGCFSLAAGGGAWGHKLLVTAVVEADGALKVLAFFPDGTPAREVAVKVIPEDGRPPLKGQTDEEGALKLARLEPGNYRVEAGDPLGHLGETRVVIANGPAGAGPPSGAAPSGAPARVRELFPWGSVLGGLGFIFGVAAFVMVLSLRREVRKRAPRD